MSLAYFQFARAVLFHFARTHRIEWVEHNALLDDLAAKEILLSGCEGKQTYDSFEHAAAVVKRQGGHRSLQPYRCQICNRYHLGNVNSVARRAHDRLKAKRRGAAYA